jgi:hypothetical protein
VVFVRFLRAHLSCHCLLARIHRGPGAFPRHSVMIPLQRTSPNHALQRTAPGVTLAAADRPAACAHPAPAAFPQSARRPPQSLSLESFGVSLALPVNNTLLTPFRTHALANPAAFYLAFLASRELLLSRSFRAASAFGGVALPERHSLRLRRCLSPARTSLGGSLFARRFPFRTRTLHAVALQPRTPNHALQRTAPARHTGCSPRLRPQPPFRSRCAAPPQSLSLGSFGDCSRVR